MPASDAARRYPREEGLLTPAEPRTETRQDDDQRSRNEREARDDNDALGPEGGEVVDANPCGEKHIDARDEPGSERLLELVHGFAMGKTDVPDRDRHHHHCDES